MKDEIQLWPQGVPAPHDVGLREERTESDGVVRIRNTQNPSILLQLVAGVAASRFVVVCPGGGYEVLAWDKEGVEIADWLNSLGISAAVLKYRTSRNREGALQDLQRTIGIVRHNADCWNVDSNRIGVLGFSAGGHLAASLGYQNWGRTYATVDKADAASCRPDFMALIYPAYLLEGDSRSNGEWAVNQRTPPTFVVHTQDDAQYFSGSLLYYANLVREGVPTEFHAYPDGGHGYGIRPIHASVFGWREVAEKWLKRR